MTKFEIGKTYWAYQKEYGSITILKKTDKTISVRSDCNIEWRMKIRHTANGSEYAIDSSVPMIWRDAFTYFSDNEI